MKLQRHIPSPILNLGILVDGLDITITHNILQADPIGLSPIPVLFLAH